MQIKLVMIQNAIVHLHLVVKNFLNVVWNISIDI